MNDKYSYQESWTGAELLAAKFPLVVATARYSRHLEDATTATPGVPIVDKTNLHSIDRIPPVHLVKQARDKFNSLQTTEGYVQIAKVGCVTHEVLVLWIRVHNFMDFAEHLRGMLEWLGDNNNGNGNDKDANMNGAFVDSLRQKLLSQVDIIKHRFTSPCGSISISSKSVLDFSGERWIDDEAVDGILTIFQQMYAHRGRYLFIPTQMFSLWLRSWRSTSTQEPSLCPWDWSLNSVQEMMEEAKEKVDVKAFAVTDLEDHWGSVCVDFVEKRILFGHSTDRGLIKNHAVFDVTRNWLENCGVPTKEWSVARLNVAQQLGGSGSCGINAVNAIERCIKPSVEIWTRERSRHHRLRYLRLLIEGFNDNDRCSTEDDGNNSDDGNDDCGNNTDGSNTDGSRDKGHNGSEETNRIGKSPEFPWAVGDIFNTHTEAKDAIQAWSLKVGFDVRFGSVQTRVVECSCARKPKTIKNPDPSKWRDRSSSRTD
ncbi:hypothetical protein BGX34_006032, partial [Mortierella sp. NVP85]